MYMAYLRPKMLIYLSQEVQIALLLAKKVIILDENLDFANIISKKLATKFPKYSNIN